MGQLKSLRALGSDQGKGSSSLALNILGNAVVFLILPEKLTRIRANQRGVFDAVEHGEAAHIVVTETAPIRTKSARANRKLNARIARRKGSSTGGMVTLHTSYAARRK